MRIVASLWVWGTSECLALALGFAWVLSEDARWLVVLIPAALVFLVSLIMWAVLLDLDARRLYRQEHAE